MGKNEPVTITKKAGEDLSEHQYCFVQVNKNGKIIKAINRTRDLGVLQNAPKEGDDAIVAISGIVKMKAPPLLIRWWKFLNRKLGKRV